MVEEPYSGHPMALIQYHSFFLPAKQWKPYTELYCSGCPSARPGRVRASKQKLRIGDCMDCACGCGDRPVKGVFLPGHDQRLRADLERRVGGLIQLRMLVEAAEYFVAGDVGILSSMAWLKTCSRNQVKPADGFANAVLCLRQAGVGQERTFRFAR